MGKNPKPYSKTTNAELKAIQVLESLLDVNFVKSYINKSDKIPNHDGRIEINNEQNIPIGEIVVQIKKENPKKPKKFSFEINYFYFCSQSLNPVIAFLVDTINEIAYWEYFDYLTLENLKGSKNKTITINFSDNKTICKGSIEYLAQWIAIINDERKKKIDSNKAQIEVQKLKKELESVNKIKDSSYGKKDEIFIEIHKFLDIYNNLLDYDFQVVKQIYFPNIWKLGIAISNYKANTITYAIYLIEYSKNDTQIKISEKEFDPFIEQSETDSPFALFKGNRIRVYFSDNPIKNNFQSHAYSLIEDDLKTILKERILLLMHTYIAHELLTEFIDDYYSILNLPFNIKEYSINSVENGLNNYLQLLLDTANLINKHKNYYNIDSVLFDIQEENKEKIFAETNAKYLLGEKLSYSVILKSDHYNLNHIFDLIFLLKSQKIDNILRLYEIKEYPQNESYCIPYVCPPENFKNRVMNFYLNLPIVYNSILENYFPRLKTELTFFNDFNKLIVVACTRTEQSSGQQGYGITCWYFKNLSNPNENSVEVYCDSLDTEIPVPKNIWQIGGAIIINNQNYQLLSASNRSADFIFDNIPMYNKIYKLLTERFKIFFNKRIKKNRITL